MDDIRRKRLFKAVEDSYKDLEPFRCLQRSLIEEYAGDGYGGGGKEGQKRQIIVNLLNQTVEAYMMALAANRPQVLVSTRHAELKPFAAHFQVGLNNLIEEINLEQTIRRWVLDAFFCLGIVKVHMASSGLVQIEQDLWADPGRPFASNVSLDNWVHDTSATKWSEVQFAGDMYRIPLEDLQDETLFDQAVAKDIQASSKYESDDERTENISRGYETDKGEFMPMVDLMDIWLPREGIIETYPIEFRNTKLSPYGEPVATMEWNGPEFGNYKLMTFNDVPENIMPTSPAQHLAALSRHINNVYRKQVRAAKNQKKNTIYRPGAEKSARSLVQANDGEMICVQDPNEIGVIVNTGADQGNQMFLLGMMDHYNSAAGNLSALLGLGASTDTVGQEKLVHGAMGGKIGQMSYRAMDSVTGLVRDLGHLLWNDQVNVIPGELSLAGVEGYTVDATWTPDMREGDFIDYNLGIDVYSMAFQSPAQRAEAIVKLLTGVYAPFMELFMQQGGTINFQKLTETFAELLNLPRIKDIVQFTGQIPDGTQMGPQGKPSNSTREYIRKSVSTGGTTQGRNIQAQQAWSGMGGGEQSGNAGNGQGQMTKPMGM